MMRRNGTITGDAGGASALGNATWAMRLCRRQLQLVGHARQVRQGRCPHLAHYLATMNLYRDFAYAEVGCDLLVQPPGRHERHDLALPRRQGLETSFQPCHGLFLLKLRSITGVTELNRFKQILLPKRLCQEFDSATLHRLYRHWNVAVSGDEDDRQLSFGACQFALQFESATEHSEIVAWAIEGTISPIRLPRLAVIGQLAC